MLTHSPNKRDETAEGWDPVAGAELGENDRTTSPLPARAVPSWRCPGRDVSCLAGPGSHGSPPAAFRRPSPAHFCPDGC